jgi:isopentenyl phosphate kinase
VNDLLFLKLGGSLITDKTGVELVRPEVLARLAEELAAVLTQRPEQRLLLGHGSGSFGHVPAARYGTRDGVEGRREWRGFAEVSASAARLNAIVINALMEAGIPAVSLPPSSSAACKDGQIVSLSTGPILAALDAGLVPVIHGDVAFDSLRGGTIVSTEEVMIHLVKALPAKGRPSWLLLAGDTNGVLGPGDRLISLITDDNFTEVQNALGHARGTDVTGGMASKVKWMLDLALAFPRLSIRIFSGTEEGLLGTVLRNPDHGTGTKIAVSN